MIATSETSDTPVGKILSTAGKHRRAGKGWLVCCPAHGDKTPSLSVSTGSDGRALLHCHAGCSPESILSAWGLDMADLFPEQTNTREATVQEIATVATFAAARKLPEPALRFCGWSDTPRGIQIEYRRRDGTQARARMRHALSGGQRFSWAGDGEIIAYELDAGELARQSGDLFIVEGESDAVTLHYAGFGVLGIPGAQFVRTLTAEHMEGVKRVFIGCDTTPAGALDDGAEKFVPDVRKKLDALGFRGPVLDLRMPDKAKDASTLFVRDPEGFKAKLDSAMNEAERGPRPKYKPLPEMVRASLRPIGERLTTGFATLDEATRGGIPLGRVIVLAGAPGAAKTGFSTYLADRWERQGCAVVYLASDEPAEGILTRLGQLSGFSRLALETLGAAGESVREGFARRCEGRELVVIDPDADESMRTIEDAEKAVLHLAGERPRVLVVDSLQTARCAASEGLESAREKMDAKLSLLKAVAKRGTLVVAISEMARGGYRSGDRNTDVSALAAGKESGSIEYGATLLLGLRSAKGEQGQIDVEVAKNRLGGAKPEFRIQLDAERATFVEVAMPTAGEASQATEEARWARARQRVLGAVALNPGMASASFISRKAGGTKSDNLAMVRELLEEGALVKVDGVFQVPAGSTEAAPNE